MKFYIKTFMPVFILLLSIAEVKSQPVISPPGSPSKSQVFISVGLEPELITTIGYMHGIGEGTAFQIGGGLKFAPLIASDAWRVNLTGAADWRMSGQWKTRFTSSLYLAHGSNRAGVMNGLGFELRAAPMHHGKTWAKGIDFGWQYTPFTHIRHSEETRDTFRDRYEAGESGAEGPVDGWYRNGASRFRLGFTASKRLDRNWGFQLGIGSILSVQKQGILLGFAHAQVPLYFESTISYRY